MGSVRSRMLRATTTTTTTVLLLLLQAPAYRQDPVRPQANSVLTDAAASLKDAMALDYDVLPMFKDITNTTNTTHAHTHTHTHNAPGLCACTIARPHPHTP